MCPPDYSGAKVDLSDGETDLEAGEIFSDDEEAAYYPQLVKSRWVIVRIACICMQLHGLWRPCMGIIFHKMLLIVIKGPFIGVNAALYRT